MRGLPTLAVVVLCGCTAGGTGPDTQEPGDAGPADTGSGDGVCSPGELPVALELVDLGSLDGASDSLANAVAINDAGEVVGASEGGEHGGAFYWDGDELHELEAQGDMTAARGAGINDSGVIVGVGMQEMPEAGGWGAHAFVWTSDEGVQGLGTDHTYSEATDLSDGGWAVGTESWEAVVWEVATGEERFRALSSTSTSEATSSFQAISETHMAVGQASDDAGYLRPVYWTEATGLVRLPDIGGTYGEARGVGESGEVLTEQEDEHGFMRCMLHWPLEEGREPEDLGLLDDPWEVDACAAEAMNGHGMAVGWDRSFVFSGITTRAWVWSDAQKLDLNRLLSEAEQVTWQLTAALDINDAGQMVGIAIHDGVPGRAWVATPVCP